MLGTTQPGCGCVDLDVGEDLEAQVVQTLTRLGIPASTLSHHIAHLMRNNLVSQQREGRVLRCTANYAAMDDLLGFLTRECCQESDC